VPVPHLRIRFAALAPLTLLVTSLAFAQDTGYRKPPDPIGGILTAPRLPRGTPSISPDGARMVVPDLPSLIPIADLAEPVEKLAGLEILPALRVKRSALKFAATGISIQPLGAGAAVRAKLPDDARVVGLAWSNDGKRLACALVAKGGADLWIVDATSGAAKRIDGETVLLARL